MRTACSRSHAGVVLATCLLAACARVEDGGQVELTQRPLSGLGAVFWQPLPNELVTHVYYCYRDDDAPEHVQTVIHDGLTNTWGRHARIAFHNEGGCGSAEHAAEAVRLVDGSMFGWGLTSPLGTPLRGGTVGHAMFPYALSYTDKWVESLGFDYVVAMNAVHEFAHVLGFGHESGRPDFMSSEETCPHGHPAGSAGDGFSGTDTLITQYDKYSVTETGYCRTPGGELLSNDDIAGVQAIYGGPNTFVYYSSAAGSAPADFYAALRLQQPAPEPGTSNAIYLSAPEGGVVGSRSHIDHDEHLRFVSIDGQANSMLKYGDTVAMIDDRGRFLSARDDGTVTTVDDLAAWEHWVVDAVDEQQTIGDGVLVNGPVRLRSPEFGRWFTVDENGAVWLTDDLDLGVWRINGRFTQP